MPDMYRGFEISFDMPPIPFRGWDWQAVDPNSDGELMIASGATREECEAGVDEYLLENENGRVG